MRRVVVVSKGLGEVTLPVHDGIVVGGRTVPCHTDVVHWRDSGLEVEVGHGARRRVEDVRFLVLHWTGGERDAFGVFDTLQRGRKVQLGSEWIIDSDGIVFQTCDPADVDTFDAGRWNPVSCGVEVVNYGFRRGGEKVPPMGASRRRYVTRWNGASRTYAAFTRSQTASIVALCDSFCKAFGLPHAIPREQDGDFAARTLHPRELDTFRGVLGHCHLTASKSDPGTEIFDALDAAGYD